MGADVLSGNPHLAPSRVSADCHLEPGASGTFWIRRGQKIAFNPDGKWVVVSRFRAEGEDSSHSPRHQLFDWVLSPCRLQSIVVEG